MKTIVTSASPLSFVQTGAVHCTTIWATLPGTAPVMSKAPLQAWSGTARQTTCGFATGCGCGGVSVGIAGRDEDRQHDAGERDKRPKPGHPRSRSGMNQSNIPDRDFHGLHPSFHDARAAGIIARGSRHPRRPLIASDSAFLTPHLRPGAHAAGSWRQRGSASGSSDRVPRSMARERGSSGRWSERGAHDDDRQGAQARRSNPHGQDRRALCRRPATRRDGRRAGHPASPPALRHASPTRA